MTRNFAMSLSARFLTGCFALLLVAGVGLRFVGLDKKSLWADELFTFAIAKYYPLLPEEGQPLFRRIQVLEIGDGDTFLTVKAAEQSPPLNDLLEKATISLLGPSDFAARLPAAVAACALLIWFAGVAWLHPDPFVRRVLRWSVCLLVFYPLLVLYAKEGRAYSVGVSLVGMAGLLWMLRWRSTGPSWRPPSWLEIGLYTLACFAHYNAALLVALLLLPDALMATKLRSGKAWVRLLFLVALFSMWLWLNLHAVLFTSNGGASWGRVGAWEHVVRTLRDSLTALHWRWLVVAIAVWFTLVLIRRRQGETLWCAMGSADLWALVGLSIVYIGLAGVVTSKAGMSHPRYFIFIVPFVAVMTSLIFSQLKQPSAILLTAIVLVSMAITSIRSDYQSKNDDFRIMSKAAIRDVDANTIFIYPWKPNRNLYRVYLEYFLKEDPRARMIGISAPAEAQNVCRRINGYRHIVAIGHESGRHNVNVVYKLCGQHWRKRSQEHFEGATDGTFTEHWLN